MSAKELGMIHTANFEVQTGGPSQITSIIGSLDVSGALTNQLQRNIRQGNYFKVVGIDIGIDTTGTLGGGQISGELRYMSPTRGRCAAYRAAFKAMAETMNLQGISMRDNALYDFRVPLTTEGGFAGSVGLQPFQNWATLDGSTGLAMVGDGSTPGSDVTNVHNRSVKPVFEGTTGELFQPGFDTILQDSLSGTDFVLNDAAQFSGDIDYASPTFETIPFVLTWTPDTTDLAVKFSWQPDPALYLAVMTGQFDIYMEELNLDGSNEDGLNLRVAVHVAGWRSIMGDPDKRKKRGRGSRRNHSARRK